MSAYTDIDTHKLVLLYVEDDEYIMAHTKVLLKKFFLKVHSAHDGESGFELFQKHRDEIDIVVTDIKMPTANGIEMCMNIRRINPKIPIVIATAYTDKDYLMDSIELGVSSYIMKPFNFLHLVMKIKEAYYPIYEEIKIKELNENLALEVKKRTRELEELNIALEQRVKEEVAENIKKEKLLQEKNRLAQMGEMINMIAHQWRQPLTSISTATIAIQSKLALEKYDLSKEDGRENCIAFLNKKINAISGYVEFLSHTIDDFRSFFKPDKQKQDIKIEEIIKKSVRIVKDALKLNNIELELKLNSTAILNIYQNEVIQVFMNIIKNANEQLAQSSVDNPKVTIETIDTKQGVLVEIYDNGGGIEEEIIDKIFDPYFSTKDEKSGTGIGLYMSKTIIEKHCGGSLSVKNRDEGACFMIEFTGKSLKYDKL